ncbi:MAG TPA: HDOD domain-containing protein [Blastocatellia bacterium]|nr:HDOD domain-containing protein [Blastocatellia bacterium]
MELSSLKIQSRPTSPALTAASEAMDRPPEALIALNEVLRRIPVDLRELGCVARFFAMPASELLKLCNSSIFALDHPVHSLEQAAISLGADALRTLGQAWGFVHRAGNLLAPSQAREFWRHNLAVALISERIAAWRCYSVPDAYLAGFLHDIGRVPLMTASQEQRAPLRNHAWRVESTQAETLAFGIDHCELGIRIARRWDFPESFLRVVRDHHQLEVEGDEPELVRIVSAAEALCSQPCSAAAEGSACSRLDHHRNVLSRRLPDLSPQEIRTLAEALTMELLFAPRGERLGLRKSVS